MLQQTDLLLIGLYGVRREIVQVMVIESPRDRPDQQGIL